MKNRGKFIPVPVAKKQLQSYIKNVLPKRDVAEKDAVLGNLFSLDNVKKLISFIDDYNQKTSNPNQKITDIRIYNGWNDDSIYDDKSTVFLVPVKENGQDYQPIYKSTSETTGDDESTLGEPEPCPNCCSSI